MKPRVPLAVAAFACVAAALVLLASAGCGPSRPSSPEELFAKLQELNAAGDSGGIWDLMTDQSKREFMDAIDGYRKIIRGNPNDKTDKIFLQYKCTRQEILTLSYVELCRRENLGKERLLVGAKIVERLPDPRNPDDVVLKSLLPGGARVYMRGRHVGSGWELVNFRVESQ